jgi:Ca2+-binding RTX toxin-like protein
MLHSFLGKAGIYPARGKERRMRRVVLLLTVMATALVMASGAALAVNKVGTDGPDTLRGTNGDDNLLGKGGGDRLLSLAGDDNLLGGPGKDIVVGGTAPGAGFGGSDAYASGGNKNLFGGTGNDWVNGGRGSDNVVGGDGNDVVVDGPDLESSTDNVSAGGGNDLVAARNKPAHKDLVVCGDGFDRVMADGKDVVAANCERVADTQAEVDALFESIPQSFWEGLPPVFG